MSSQLKRRTKTEKFGVRDRGPKTRDRWESSDLRERDPLLLSRQCVWGSPLFRDLERVLRRVLGMHIAAPAGRCAL
eukprot:CAMPEP_0119064052 /NCGR_PEP_ID=MMETSP1178-20130426/7242_1 /TAXON_ID=33656 /ORGANISM="unid sp, Strain CCMP2000" /LENGTH=75 /DNA_ID=CAMNT_0007045459 /DNA_START=54 /DNA_END=277 /DNA_ORIENTATION=+